MHRNPALSCDGATLLACRRLSPRRALVKDLDLVVQLEALSPQLGVRCERAPTISVDTGGIQRSRLPVTTRVLRTSSQFGATSDLVLTISSAVRGSYRAAFGILKENIENIRLGVSGGLGAHFNENEKTLNANTYSYRICLVNQNNVFRKLGQSSFVWFGGGFLGHQKRGAEKCH